MALGVGGLSGSFHADVPSATDNDLSGVAVLDELAFGGTPSPGVVIGGGIYGSTTPSPKATVAGIDFNMGAVGAGVVGPFIDIYPNPARGLHLEAAFGLAVLTASKGDLQRICDSFSCENIIFPGDDYVGTGFGFVGGIGYEGWVGEQWSIGGLARSLDLFFWHGEPVQRHHAGGCQGKRRGARSSADLHLSLTSWFSGRRSFGRVCVAPSIGVRCIL